MTVYNPSIPYLSGLEHRICFGTRPSASPCQDDIETIKHQISLRKWRAEHFPSAAASPASSLSSSSPASAARADAARKTDVVLLSSDGIAYPTRRLHLAYGSEVLADLLSMPTSPGSDDSGAPAGPAVLRMEERAEDGLDVFMSLVTPGARFGAPKWTFDDLIRALYLSDKLDSDLLRLSLPPALLVFLPTHAPLLLAHGVLLQHFPLARAALAHFHADLAYDEHDEFPPEFSMTEDWNWSPPPKVTTGVSGRVVRLSAVPEDLVARFPSKLFCQLVQSQERLLVDWRTYRPKDVLLEFEACWDVVFPNTR